MSESQIKVPELESKLVVHSSINALLGLCSCFYVQVFVVNYFLNFRGFFLG